MDRIDNKLPNDPLALVLGIVSLVVLLLGCCCGLFAMMSLTLSIIALVMANRSLSMFALEPDIYALRSYKNMHSAKIIGIVGIVLSGLTLAAQLLFMGQISKSYWDEFQQRGFKSWEWRSDDAEPTDSGTNNERSIILKKQGDSIVVDSSAAITQ